MKGYRKRIADEILKRKLEGKGAVLIEGPKWCGKTTTAEQIAKSILYMDDPETKEQNITMSELSPKRLLRGETPRLIDEWQLAPKLWDAIRFEVDHRGELGQFVLTGSAVPPDTKEITHSGTGRFTWLTMRPMSLFESGESTGEVSLNALFSQPEELDGESRLDIDRLAFLVCRGGWPQAVGMRDEIALDQAIDYYDAVVHADINRVDNVKKDPERVKRLMRSYARNQGSQVPNTVIAQDIAANNEAAFDAETVAAYLNALRKIFVVEDMPAWNPNLRSKTAIRSSNTRYYVDPSIAAAALGISLCENDQQLHIIPGTYTPTQALRLPGVKVMMKNNLPATLEALRQMGASAAMVENCGMENEKIYRKLEDIPENAGYFSLLIVK